MIVDSSAIIAILLQEPEADRCSRALALADSLAMSTATWVEINIVLRRRGDQGLVDDAAELRTGLGIRLVPFDERQSAAAIDAFARFGKGNHPARLNFGDCFAYALAKQTGEPLLFVGGDFARTDIAAA